MEALGIRYSSKYFPRSSNKYLYTSLDQYQLKNYYLILYKYDLVFA